MKLVEYQSLTSSAIAIQPHLAWMLAIVPDLILDPDRQKQVEKTLEDLNVKFARLNGQIIDLDSRAFNVNTDDILIIGEDSLVHIEAFGESVVLVSTARDIESLKTTEEALRDALAEIIVTRGEAELAAEAREEAEAEADAWEAEIEAAEAEAANVAAPNEPLDVEFPSPT